MTKPVIDWFALSPSLALLAAAGVALLGAVLVPQRAVRVFSALACALGFLGAGVAAGLLYWKSPEATYEVAEAIRRDRFGMLAQLVIAGAGFLAVGISYSQRVRKEHIGEYYALLEIGRAHV